MKKLTKKIKKIILWIISIYFILTILWAFFYRFINPPFTPLMVVRYVQDDKPGKVLQKNWKDIDYISKNAVLAVIAAEDQSFFSHWGFDFNEINKAVLAYEKRGGFRGASTISQQTAKNVFLLPVRSWLRKGFESYFTILIELLWGKKRIIEVYLNVAELGEGIYGVEAASNHYFGKPSGALTMKESAFLASLLPNPRLYYKKEYSDYRKQRIGWILKQMKNLGGVEFLE
jgi:monofunctional biosynthetic peptidoglycan transglycosylase